MSEQLPQPFDTDMPQIPGFTDHGIVEPNRRLISVEVAHEEAIEEYTNLHTKERLIALSEYSESAELHRKLARRGIQVFPVVRTEGDKLLLDVPAEARTVLSSLRFFSRDVAGYAPTFRQVGDLIARVQASGFGLPDATPSRPLLNSLAVAEDENRYGSGLTLVPPYRFNITRTKSDLLDTIGGEITASSYFTQAQSDFLLREIAGGWDEFRH